MYGLLTLGITHFSWTPVPSEYSEIQGWLQTVSLFFEDPDDYKQSPQGLSPLFDEIPGITTAYFVTCSMDQLQGSGHLKSEIRDHVDPSSTIMTDELSCYTGIGKDFKGGHHTVNQSIGEYSYHGISTNQAESYFALLKRGIHGTFHHISKKHMHRYCNEFTFRWDSRNTNDGERTAEAIRGADGKRLAYRALAG